MYWWNTFNLMWIICSSYSQMAPKIKMEIQKSGILSFLHIFYSDCLSFNKREWMHFKRGLNLYLYYRRYWAVLSTPQNMTWWVVIKKNSTVGQHVVFSSAYISPDIFPSCDRTENVVYFALTWAYTHHSLLLILIAFVTNCWTCIKY